VRDAEQRTLPLTPRFQRTWELLAISGGRPVDLIGEWDGDHLFPLAAWSADRWTAFPNGAL
jgi:hypothetical protein